jgi:hypothetical protein
MVIKNVRFHKFTANMYVLADESRSWNACFRDWGARIYHVEAVTFTNCDAKRIKWINPFRSVFKLVDNSFLGDKPGYLTAFMPHIISPECVWDATTQANYNAIVCKDPDTGPKLSIKRVMFYEQKPWYNFVWRDIKIRRIDGKGIPYKNLTSFFDAPAYTTLADFDADKVHPHNETAWTVLPMTNNKAHHDKKSTWAIPFVMGQSYQISWGLGIDFTELKMRTHYHLPTEWVQLVFNVTDHREHFEVFTGDLDDPKTKIEPDPRAIIKKNATLAGTDHCGTYEYTKNSKNEIKELAVMVNGKYNDKLRDSPEKVTKIVGHRCFGDHCKLQVVNETFTP